MAIKVHLDEVLKKRGMTSINRICYFLQCDVGDILTFDGHLDDEEGDEL